MTDSSIAQPPAPGMEHRRLDAFVGTWRTEGVIRAGEHGPATPFTATDRYEWMQGGYFLLHHVRAHMGDVELTALEVIGYDAETGTYPMRSYDSQGNTGTHQATLRDGNWTFQGATERFTGSFSGDGGTITGLWEQSADGVTWVPWMDVTLTRHD
ncbi:MAG TPA: DUF1579 family protein [Longimicrobium sp.]|nr:DUF1579 family protein [Longimicrobium sp.]